MAIDRNAVIKEAQKLAGKGQFDKAIAEWRKLIKDADDKRDLSNIFNTIGDLCLKKNAKAEAADAYLRAADILAEEEIENKAIAVYRKVLNIDPSRIEVNLALGDLYARKGLNGQALENYKLVADNYKKQNAMAKALGIYQKMADLNPANVAVRVKLAEMYLKEAMNKEAVKAYLDAADQYVAKEAFQDARQMFEKVLALDPGNKDVYHKAGIVYFKEGKYAEACKALKPAFENDPENRELVALYLEALASAGRSGDAEEVYQKLLSLDPAQHEYRERLYQIYLARKDFDKALPEAAALAEFKAESVDFGGAARLLKEFIAVTHDPLAGAVALADLFSKHGRSSEGARELMQAADALIARGSSDDAREVLSRASLIAPDLEEVQEKLDALSGVAPSEQPAAPVLEEFREAAAGAFEEAALPGAPAPPGPSEEAEDPAVAEALTEVDVLMKYGLGAKAVEQLEGLVRTFPDHPKVRVRLLDLYRDQKNTMKAVVQALMLAELYEKRGEDAESRSVLRAALELAPGNPQIMAKLGMAAEEPEPEAPEAIETIEEPDTIESIPEVPELSIPELESIELEAPSGEVFEELQVPEEGPAVFEAPSAEPSVRPEVPAAPDEVEEMPAGDELLYEEPEKETPAAQPAPVSQEPAYAPPVGADEPSVEAEADEILSEAEFYYQQGLFEEARKQYENVLELRPGDRKALHRIVEIAKEREEHEEFSRLAEAVEGLESIVEAGAGPGGESVSQTDAESVRALMHEITAMRKQDMAGRRAEQIPPPSREEPEESFADLERELRDAGAASDAAAPAADAEESFADLDKQLKGGGAHAAPAAPSARTEAPAAEESDDFFDLAAELRDELSSAPKQKTAATAHEQSLDEIFEEFKKGVEAHEKKEDEDTHYNLGVAYREMGLLDDAISEFNMTNEGEAKFIHCRYMLGLCYMEKGDYETAITEIQNALGYSYSFGEASEERKGMHYDLGLALQGTGSSAMALEEFQKVFALDPAYRDVATKVQELQQGDFVSMDAIKEDIEKEISFKFLEEGARIEREEKSKVKKTKK